MTPLRRLTPKDVAHAPAPFLREVRARLQKRYGHLTGAQTRFRAAVRDVWLLCEALGMVAREQEIRRAVEAVDRKAAA